MRTEVYEAEAEDKAKASFWSSRPRLVRGLNIPDYHYRTEEWSGTMVGLTQWN